MYNTYILGKRPTQTSPLFNNCYTVYNRSTGDGNRASALTRHAMKYTGLQDPKT